MIRRAVESAGAGSSSSPPRPGSCTACGRWRPDKQFIAADPEAVCAYMKAITLTGVRDSLAARPVPHHRPARHRGARPRRDRPHGRARPVTPDAERIAAVALAEDGATDVTTALTVPAGVAGEGRHRVSRAAACSPAPPMRTRWRGPASAASNGARRRVARCAAGTVVGRRPRAARPDPPGRAADAQPSAARQRASRPPRARTLTPWRAPAAGSSTPGRRRRGFACSTWPRCWPAEARRHRFDLAPRSDGEGQPLAGAAQRRATRWRQRWPTARRRGVAALQVEVESKAQLEEACAAGATRLLVDNQPPATVRALGSARAGAACRGSRSRRRGESRWRTCAQYAEAGADFVSIGALTHSVRGGGYRAGDARATNAVIPSERGISRVRR